MISDMSLGSHGPRILVNISKWPNRILSKITLLSKPKFFEELKKCFKNYQKLCPMQIENF